MALVVIFFIMFSLDGSILAFVIDFDDVVAVGDDGSGPWGS